MKIDLSSPKTGNPIIDVLDIDGSIATVSRVGQMLRALGVDETQLVFSLLTIVSVIAEKRGFTLGQLVQALAFIHETVRKQPGAGVDRG
jgi:hypothetical protein